MRPRIGLLAGLLLVPLLWVAPAFAGYPEAPADSYRAPLEWTAPLDARLGSPFGPRWGRFHQGIDIEGWAETRVRAAAPGIVTKSGWLDNYGGLGLVVKIRHQSGFETLYAHLAKAFVQRGDVVEGGELIGRAGCTGSCSGVHLHFQMWREGKLVDPLRFLPASVGTR